MRRPIVISCVSLLFFPLLAQAASPFGVGISEGGGLSSGIFGWILAQQMMFEQALTRSIHAVVASPWAGVTLASLSFLYGVFHAAGPGHGKAVIASYMIANEQALKRGLLLSLLAALVQGVVAIALVSVMALVLHVTAQTLQGAAHQVELVSFGLIALLGLWLVWVKGRAFWGLLQPAFGHVQSGHPHHDHDHTHHHNDHVHDEHCGHYHAPEPSTLGTGFSWHSAIMTVFAAGSRPCSGAILVLVFALAQGIYWAGIVATLAMSLGTALTTGALASMAVLSKHLALKIAGADNRRTELILRGLECLAALLVLIVGVGLFFGMMKEI
jgi:nickel/cobalt transporter (NicO) family protein